MSKLKLGSIVLSVASGIIAIVSGFIDEAKHEEERQEDKAELKKELLNELKGS